MIDQRLLAICVGATVFGCSSVHSRTQDQATNPVPSAQSRSMSGSTTMMTQPASLLAGCPGGNGIHISVNSGAGASAAGSDTTPGFNIAIDQTKSVDTTIVFDVTQKTWTRTNLAAAITAGLADESRGGYAICAGVTAMMPTATLTINGAHGRVHFAATLQNLLSAIRSGPSQ